MKKIKITHQIDKTVHHFFVGDPDRLTTDEVKRICEGMNVTSLLINGKMYKK